MAEGPDLIFGIIATTRGRPTSGFKSTLPISTVDGLDVDPEQMGYLMTG